MRTRAFDFAPSLSAFPVTVIAILCFCSPAKADEDKTNQEKKLFSRILVEYKIPGAEKKGKVFVQHIGGRGVIGSEGPEHRKFNPIDNGGSLKLESLDTGKYQVTRYRNLDVCKAGPGRMLIGVFMDRHQFQLKSGETKTIRFVRGEGQRLKGRVLGLDEAKLDRAAIFVCSKNLRKAGDRTNLDVTVFDAQLCNEKGEFETELIPNGDYQLLVEAYTPPTQQELLRTGRRGPSHVAMKPFTISPKCKVEPLQLTLAARKSQ